MSHVVLFHVRVPTSGAIAFPKNVFLRKEETRFCNFVVLSHSSHFGVDNSSYLQYQAIEQWEKVSLVYYEEILREKC